MPDCPTCGAEVRTISGEEGTHHYELVEPAQQKLSALQEALEAEVRAHSSARADAEAKGLGLAAAIFENRGLKLQAILDSSRERRGNER